MFGPKHTPVGTCKINCKFTMTSKFLHQVVLQGMFQHKHTHFLHIKQALRRKAVPICCLVNAHYAGIHMHAYIIRAYLLIDVFLYLQEIHILGPTYCTVGPRSYQKKKENFLITTTWQLVPKMQLVNCWYHYLVPGTRHVQVWVPGTDNDLYSLLV